MIKKFILVSMTMVLAMAYLISRYDLKFAITIFGISLAIATLAVSFGHLGYAVYHIWKMGQF